MATPQVNCGYSGVATESHFARLREHFQKENALEFFRVEDVLGAARVERGVKLLFALVILKPFPEPADAVSSLMRRN